VRGQLSDREYQVLASFRAALRRFVRFSEVAARDCGLTPAQHQLLLAIRGFATPPPTMSQVAQSLQLRLHSVVALVQRAEQAGLVERWADPADRRRQLLRLSPTGDAKIAELTMQHRDELRRFKKQLHELLDVV
jgi:DNA-binding MarR family transcriptional regulator